MEMTALDMSDPTLMYARRRGRDSIISMSGVECEANARILDVELLPGSMDEWSKPYLHLTMAMDSVVPGVVLPYGVTELGLGDEGRLCHGYYNFEREQLAELVRKGLFTSEFSHPIALVGASWQVPVMADFAIIKPRFTGERDDIPLVFMDVHSLGSLELSQRTTGFDLTEQFETVAEYDDELEAGVVSLTKAHDVDLEREREAINEYEAGESYITVDYDSVDAERERLHGEHELPHAVFEVTGLDKIEEREAYLAQMRAAEYSRLPEDSPHKRYEEALQHDVDMDFDVDFAPHAVVADPETISVSQPSEPEPEEVVEHGEEEAEDIPAQSEDIPEAQSEAADLYDRVMSDEAQPVEAEEELTGLSAFDALVDAANKLEGMSEEDESYEPQDIIFDESEVAVDENEDELAPEPVKLTDEERTAAERLKRQWMREREAEERGEISQRSEKEREAEFDPGL